MKLKLHLLFLLLIGTFSGSLWAQYGFGTNNPNRAAALDIVSPDKGVLIPRISLTSSSTFQLDGTPTESHGMLVFNTNTITETTQGSGISNGLFGPGIYFWDQPPAGSGSWRQVGGQDLDGFFSQDSSVTSSVITLYLSGDSTPVRLDVSALEEIQLGRTGNNPPTNSNLSVAPTEGTLFLDTGSSTLWGYVADESSSTGLSWKRIEALNLYNSDGTLEGDRTVTFGDNDLNFITGTGNFTLGTNSSTVNNDPILRVRGTENLVLVGTDSFTGTPLSDYTQSLTDNNAASTSVPAADLDLVVEGDIKLGRYIVDEENNTGKIGEVLTRTDTGVSWEPHSNLFNIESASSDLTPKLDTGLLLLTPGTGTISVTLSAIGTENNQYPVGYTLRIRRNQDYSGSHDNGRIEIVPPTGATIGGAPSRFLNVGFQSITLVAVATDSWVVVD